MSDTTESAIFSQDINLNKLVFTGAGRVYKYGSDFVEFNEIQSTF